MIIELLEKVWISLSLVSLYGGIPFQFMVKRNRRSAGFTLPLLFLAPGLSVLQLRILSQLPDLVQVQVSADGFGRPRCPAGLLGPGRAEAPAAPLRAWVRSVRDAGRRRRRKRGHSLASGESGRGAAVPDAH